MAESLVSRVVFKLSELLSQEEFILTLHGRQLHDELSWIRDELLSMKCFLKDAEAKGRRDDDQLVRDWVENVIRVAFEAEDTIDNFLFKIKPHRQLQGFTACINRS
ncbi:hypothetical protein J5N97_005221 [Dioscorea zingiberensis]|uniref:Disease resistance N-terminal domain-containing protein n=1 Tax=Dioscorea zingiberensis TaxID=325984 RepID=A0A9D5D822_9LILI|nr:hypothetical protein J5N97_005204 [Dioscorea zingiberensis]KAJ0986865.1 hypothetical protein J5N97_005221 [Dioscorea zingiberensis]